VPYRAGSDPRFAPGDFLVWHHVSYLGADVLRDDGLYNWPDSSLTPAAADPTTYDAVATNDAKLTDVPVSILPPTYYDPAFYPFGAGTPQPQNVQPANIPGSTTNVPIELARRVWQTLPQAWRDTHRFPYFDTNQDGYIDLYDADGDGVPDSPISFVLTYAG